MSRNYCRGAVSIPKREKYRILFLNHRLYFRNVFVKTFVSFLKNGSCELAIRNQSDNFHSIHLPHWKWYRAARQTFKQPSGWLQERIWHAIVNRVTPSVSAVENCWCADSSDTYVCIGFYEYSTPTAVVTRAWYLHIAIMFKVYRNAFQTVEHIQRTSI